MDFYKGSIPIVDDTPEGRAYAMPLRIDGIKVGYGYSPTPPQVRMATASADPPSEMELYPESDWDAIYDEEERLQSSMEHLYLPGGPEGQPVFVNLDQNGDGYCWQYGVGHQLMFNALVAGPAVTVPRLNPHSTAAILKNGRDEGGWCGLGLKGAVEIGMAIEGSGAGQWPLHSRSLRNDTPAMRTAMAKNKSSEQWVDLSKPVYDQNMTNRQIATCVMSKNPCSVDYNEWSHSICCIRWVRVERGSWWPLIINSWRGWGRHGLAVIRNWSIDGAACSRRVTPQRRAA